MVHFQWAFPFNNGCSLPLKLILQYLNNRWEEILALVKEIEESGKLLKPTILTRIADIYYTCPKKFNLTTKAEALYRKALELAPTKSITLHKFGRMLLNDGRLDEGVKLLKQAIEVKRGNYAAHIDYLCIQFYNDAGFDMDGEFDAMMDYSQGHPNEIIALACRAQYEAWTMNFARAIDMVEKAMELQELFQTPTGTTVSIR
jgi:tetratricopeptide (TPR) repeat protein